MNTQLISFDQLNFIWFLPLIALIVLLKLVRKSRETNWFYPPLDQRPMDEKLKAGFFKESKNYYLYRLLPKPKNFAGWFYAFVTNLSIGFFMSLVIFDATTTGYVVGVILGPVFFISFVLRIVFYERIK